MNPTWFRPRWGLLALVLAVPVVGWLVAHFSDPGESFSTILGSASLLAALWGLFLLLLIWAAGAAASHSRELLLGLFRPGLYVTAVSLSLLVLVHGAISVAVLVRFFRSPFILAVGLGAIVGAIEIISNVFTLVKKAEIEGIGIAVTPEAQPRLWSHVRHIASRLNALEPEHIVVGLDPNFFVTEAGVICVNGPASFAGRTLYCSLPLMRILDRGELTSILGHELGHFKGKDTRFSEKFYPIYRGTASALAAMTLEWDDDESDLALLPAVAVLGYFMETFSHAELALGRARELAADAQGASISNARVAAAALVKIHAFSPLWGAVQQLVDHEIVRRSLFMNLSDVYFDEASGAPRSALLQGISERHLEHPTDSHPSLHVRLAELGVSLESVASEGLRTVVPEPAIGLLDDSRSLERKLSTSYQELMAQIRGINLERLPQTIPNEEKSSWSAKKRRERLASSRKRRR